MPFSRSFTLAAIAALLSSVMADANAICYSYGVDFVDEGNYFINSQLSEQFSSVSYFKGCNQDVADVLLVEPEGVNSQEYLCDQMTTYPNDDLKTSTCPIRKNQMISGHWRLLVLGNNGDEGQPFAWQRDLYLTYDFNACGDSNNDNYFYQCRHYRATLNGDASKWNREEYQDNYTSTDNNNVYKDYDKDFAIFDQALATPTTIPKLHRFIRKADRAVDVEWARARIEAAKQRRTEMAREAAAPLERRAPDAPTLTVTADVPVNTTTTILAPATTTTETVLTSATVTSTLPPATVFSGLFTSTITLPTPTKTQLKLSFATTTKVITFGATFTKHTTVTPTTSVSACKKAGGHFW
ncbi:hypothetical protein SNOG_06826 [Parastagonospora nodorum SN15]|uniref:Uncharacterized protein n=1 Tax=Phaeosphaeria nodorum (strain SN15 / ATCC MYA-4574 / FGSC 10173) TaxID=321614 RepID=Q0UN38_PHANO|nr:hypothetical protein SNOG_06826 [Parastagonospora nodorum SN15]EAT85477.2 hypothetical protein SNOG_06826 [Parastagonospora nodorum SN15]